MSESELVLQPDAPVKRKRGRPRKIRDPNEPEKVKKKRGRPRKKREPDVPDKIKKKRGRPRKIRDPNEAVKVKRKPRLLKFPVGDSMWTTAVEPEVEIRESESSSEINFEENFGKTDLEEIGESKFVLTTKTCQICRIEFQQKERLKLEENISLCDSCCDSVNSHALLCEDENFNPHPKPKFLCDKCPKSFHNSYHLKRHMITHSDLRPFECKLCNQGFKRRDKLVDHVKRIHEGEQLGLSFLQSEEIENVDTSVIHKKCDRCGNNNGVVEICLGNDNSSVHLCEVCNPSRLSEGNDNVVSEEPKLFSCEFCTKMFTRKDHVTRHKLIHTSDKTFNCDFCDKSYTRKDKLLRHLLVHPEARPYLKQARRNVNVDSKAPLPIFSCEFCGKQFKDKYSFEKHITVIHNQELSFPCQWCEEKLASRELLRKHTETHRNGPMFQCPECDKVLLSSKSFRRHIDSHKAEAPYKCETCSKSFKRKDKLKTHSLTHLDIRPYSCDLCHVSFKRKDKYFQHCKQLHTSNSEEEFMDLNQCDVCDESFACEDDLSEHKMTHYR